jgi:hypothetical protein
MAESSKKNEKMSLHTTLDRKNARSDRWPKTQEEWPGAPSREQEPKPNGGPVKKESTQKIDRGHDTGIEPKQKITIQILQ